MIIKDFEQGSEEWLEFRKGKVSGTRLGEFYSPRGTRKQGFYKTIAERLALDPDDENRMDRGLRLEAEAREEFEKRTGKNVTCVGVCISELHPRIINSPDGLIKEKPRSKFYTEALEIKCLSPARHLEAVIENVIPKEFESQVAQYFVVNEKLERLYVLFYDPRIVSVPYHVITVERGSIEDKIQAFTDFQLEELNEIDKIVERLSF
jgi:hypothetical protein